MRFGRFIAAMSVLACAGLGSRSLAGDIEIWSCPKGDAVIRRTDSCNCGTLLPGTGTPGQGQGLPDLVAVTLCAWQPTAPETDLFTGSIADHDGPSSHFFRMQVVFDGLVNPPGTIGLSPGSPFNPFQFGTSPLHGFIEVDVDDDHDTGGETTGVAALRFLGNAARFGTRPHGSFGARAAMSGEDLNQPWESPPQVCRSGADWVLSFCGCFPATVLCKNNPADTTFGVGDTWVVQGRYFQRAGGYQQASAMFGGSAPGLYDPPVNLRFAHNATTNETTVTLVFPLTQTGAGLAAGQPAQPMDFNASNQTSIAEGVQDLIARAQNLGATSGLARELVRRWASKSFSSDVRDPTQWEVHALVGTTYSTPCDGLYVWTDVGFELVRGDLDGDGTVCQLDQQLVQGYIVANDGSAERDTDATANGQVGIVGFGVGFHAYDVDGDGIIGPLDVAFFNPASPPCIADFNQSGSTTVDDLFLYMNAWFTGHPTANVNGSAGVTVDDLFFYFSAYFTGCP